MVEIQAETRPFVRKNKRPANLQLANRCRPAHIRPLTSPEPSASPVASCPGWHAMGTATVET